VTGRDPYPDRMATSSSAAIRPGYSTWPLYNQRLRELVGALTEDQLALRRTPDRWPLWATIGHLACQRVFWLCDFAGEPGAETTPFTNAGYNCPGDDDLEHVLSAADLRAALEATFRIVEHVLDTWTPEMLAEDIHRTWDNGQTWVHTRGWALQRVFSHDVYHIAELNEALADANLPLVDLWS
jgi:uncharacterized damage-inducible protein DinB